MAIKFQIKRSNTATWTSTNPTLAEGELGFETNTNKLKIGNGSNTWNTLSYIAGGVVDFESTGAVANSIISNGINFIRTAGYYAIGDEGGAYYKRSSGSPTGPGTRYISSGDGATWEIILDSSINVLQFGADKTGILNSSNSFNAAHTFANISAPIIVPSGTYKLDDEIDTDRRIFVLHGANIPSTESAKLSKALLHRIDQNGGISYGVGERAAGSPYQYGSYYKFGRNDGGPIGLVIGGGQPSDGSIGNALFADSYGGWTTIQPLSYPGAVELALQPSAIAGSCNVSINGNTVTRVSGAEFESSMIGKRIYLGDLRYLVNNVVTSNSITVTELNGTNASFPATRNYTYVCAPVIGFGVCNVSGNLVSRISGDPFVIDNAAFEYKIKIASNTYTVSDQIDSSSLRLIESAGNQTQVNYEFWTTVDDLMAAFRVHRISGAGFEENLTIGAYGSGYFHIQAAGSTTLERQYPLYLGSGYNSDYSKRIQVAMQENGTINLGGNFDRCSLKVNYRDVTLSNHWEIGGANSGGGTPGIAVIGPSDTNISAAFTTKGTGQFLFFSNNYVHTSFTISGSPGNDRLSVEANTGAPSLKVDDSSSSSNVDLRLIPKGSAGRIRFGSGTTATNPANFVASNYFTMKLEDGTTIYVPYRTSSW